MCSSAIPGYALCCPFVLFDAILLYVLPFFVLLFTIVMHMYCPLVILQYYPAVFIVLLSWYYAILLFALSFCPAILLP